jgi:hypothetical protein
MSWHASADLALGFVALWSIILVNVTIDARERRIANIRRRIGKGRR